MDAIVHIGMEKTGTSSIQKTFATNRGLLRRSKVAYLRSPGRYNHRALSLISQDNPLNEKYSKNLGIEDPSQLDHYRREFLARFDHELEKLKPWANTVIISSEHLQSRLLTLDEVHRFEEFIESKFETITIVAYLRRQDRQCVSLDSTRSRMSKITANVLPKKFNARQLAYYDYANLIDRWSAVFGEQNLIVREYDSVVQSSVGGIIIDFAKLCGIKNPEVLRLSKSENLALNYKQRRACKWIQDNLHHESQKFCMAFKRFAIFNFQDRELPPELPSKDEAIRFYSSFEESNRELDNKMNNGYAIFSDDFDFYQNRSIDLAWDSIDSEMGKLVQSYKRSLRNPLRLFSSYTVYFYYLHLPSVLKNRIYKLFR